jgi:hypothetical protein
MGEGLLRIVNVRFSATVDLVFILGRHKLLAKIITAAGLDRLQEIKV